MPVPNIYEDTTPTHGTGALSVPWGTHNDTFTAILVVTCAGGDTLGTPTQSGADGTWTLIDSCAVGTGAGSVQIGAWWCRATSGSMSNVDVPDAGDHTSAKMFMLQNVVASGNPINMSATQTVDVADDAISFAAPDTTVQNCLVFCLAGCGFDQTTNPGGSGWTNAGLDTIGFGGQYCTDNGTGGGYMGGVGEKAVAGSCGTFAHTWASGNTKQANIIFAISDTETVGGGDPPIEGTLAVTLAAATSSGTGAVDVAGTAAVTLESAAASGAGSVDVGGTLGVQLAEASAAGAGGVDVAGALAVSLGAATVAGTGEVPVDGALGLQLEDATVAASGALGGTTGQLAVTLEAAVVAGVGGVDVAGSLAIELPGATVSSLGAVPIVGTLAVQLAAATVSASSLPAIPVEAVIGLVTPSVGASLATPVVGASGVTPSVGATLQGDS